MRTFARFLLVSAILLVACNDEVARDAGNDGSREPTGAIAFDGDLTLIVFDIETALEAVHAAAERYPTTVEFEVEDSWSIYRERLGDAFSEWSYESDGTTYRLRGSRGSEQLEITSLSQ